MFQTFCSSLAEVGGKRVFDRKLFFSFFDEVIYCVGFTSITLLQSLHYAKVVTSYTGFCECLLVRLN